MVVQEPTLTMRCLLAGTPARRRRLGVSLWDPYNQYGLS